MSKSPNYACKPYFKLRKMRLGGIEPGAAVTGESWTVPNLCAAYSWPTGLGGGGVIAIVELGGGWIESDITSFFQSIGQPVPSITNISVDGTENSPGQSGSAGEADFDVALDIEVAGASYYAATGKAATIRVY
jgi:kumamolisin